MNRKLFLSLFIGLLFNQCMISVDAHASASGKNISNSLNDNEIIGTLVVVDKNEIALADKAIKKTTDPVIKQYAVLLKKDHTQNLKETLKLSGHLKLPVEENQSVRLLKEGGKIELSKLSAKDKSFDNDFIQLMINDHKHALKLIDVSLIKVSNPELKKFLIQTRPHIAFHLRQAQKIKDQLLKN